MRWVEVKPEYTISWSIQPQKKSINFGIFKHPGSGKAPAPILPSSTFEPPQLSGLRPKDSHPESNGSQNVCSVAVEKLKSIGLQLVHWHGTCEPNRVSMGKYDVPLDEGGMYAMVFDNTFSKQTSKTATFVLLTYPTSTPPLSSHHMHYVQGSGLASTSRKSTKNPSIAAGKRKSSDSIHQIDTMMADVSNTKAPPRLPRADSDSSYGSNFLTGVLQKRRRKRHQGWAKRFFSLDHTAATLSYYHNRSASALRGAVPLSLAVISVNSHTRDICIDSGAEVWHLRAINLREFEAWTTALEHTSKSVINSAPLSTGLQLHTSSNSNLVAHVNPDEERDWLKVETLVSRVAGSRDAVRRLAQDTDPKYLPLSTFAPPGGSQVESNPLQVYASPERSPVDQSFNTDGGMDSDKRPFWKKKASTERTNSTVFRRSVSAQSGVPSVAIPRSNGSTGVRTPSAPESTFLYNHPEEGLHEHCLAVLRDLDVVVAEFAALVVESKQRRNLPVGSPTSHTSRLSIDSQGSQEFFDAQNGDNSPLLAIQQESDEEDDALPGLRPSRSEDSASASEIEDLGGIDMPNSSLPISPSFPTKPKSLSPLPLSPIKRREFVAAPMIHPPSLIGFLRKNVGKDLSTISMPVSANEPLSLLQRASEQLEYSTLLDEAAKMPKSSINRLLYISAFAISSLSSARVKERSLRKPFNPMLGETFELVREDRGFRFIAEKVSHHPICMACQADSEKWAFTQAPRPIQKFWGKSAEVITDGAVRIILHESGDRFSWTPVVSFIRNIIAGEKYVEPVGTMTITNEVTREQAVVTSKSKGMFSGRSEDVVVQTFDSHGKELSVALVGKWTSSLTKTENNISDATPIWTVANLVPDVTKRYGLTNYAASLNEITAIEKGNIAPTDSRLRPDQRAVEDGNLDEAESLKTGLEEAQRNRRKVMVEQGVEWRPRWFTRIEGGDEVAWKLKGGKDGYWEERVKGEWKGVENVFEI